MTAWSEPSLRAFFASGHKAIYGKTRSGKSYALKWMYKRVPHPWVAIFISPHDDLPQGERARTPTEIKAMVARRVKRIVWRAPKDREVEGGRDEVIRQIGVIVGDLVTTGRQLMKGDTAEPWVVIFWDECHNFTSKTGYIGPLEESLSEGMKYGLRCVLASQRPARVSLEVLGQADTVMIFKLEPPDAKYLRNAGYPIDAMEPWLEEPRRFTLMRGKAWEQYDKLPE